MTTIREARLAKGISQMQVAIAVGVSLPVVSLWETLKVCPQEGNRRRLAELLDVPEDELEFAPYRRTGKPLETVAS